MRVNCKKNNYNGEFDMKSKILSLPSVSALRVINTTQYSCSLSLFQIILIQFLKEYKLVHLRKTQI